MKKVILAGLVITCGGLMANDYYVNLGVGNYDFSRQITKVSTNTVWDTSDDGGFQSITFGYKINDKYRTGVTYYNINDAKNVDIFHSEIFVDYIIPTETVIKPFLGASIGYLSDKESGLTALNHTPDSVEIKGMAYGVRAGLSWNFTDKMFAEICYAHKKVNADGTTTGLLSGSKYNWEVDEAKGFSLGFGYKF